MVTINGYVNTVNVTLDKFTMITFQWVQGVHLDNLLMTITIIKLTMQW
jgi:hypothetical protein